MVALVVATLAAFAIERLNHYTDERIRAQVQLSEIKEAGDHQHLEAVEALVEGEVPPETVEETGEHGREVRETLEQLERLNVDEGRLARVREGWSAAEAASGEVLRLVNAGQLEQAEALDDERIHPAFEAFEGAARTRREARKRCSAIGPAGRRGDLRHNASGGDRVVGAVLVVPAKAAGQPGRVAMGKGASGGGESGQG